MTNPSASPNNRLKQQSTQFMTVYFETYVYLKILPRDYYVLDHRFPFGWNIILPKQLIAIIINLIDYHRIWDIFFTERIAKGFPCFRPHLTLWPTHLYPWTSYLNNKLPNWWPLLFLWPYPPFWMKHSYSQTTHYN